MTAKPIFIVRVPNINFPDEKEMYERILKDLRITLPDYHVLLCGDNTIKTTQFECFNAVDATETNIQAIQDMILKTLEMNELSDWDVTLMDGLEDE